MRLLVLADEPPPADPAELAERGGVDAVVTLGDLEPACLAPLARLDVPCLGVPRYVVQGHTTPNPRTRTRRLNGTEVVWVRGARTVVLAR